MGELERKARKGDVESQVNLGLMFSADGRVLYDWAEASRWFRMAADQGDSTAQFMLGLGELDRNPVEAMIWLQKAAEQGHAEAQYELGKLIESGDLADFDFDDALKWYEKAADQLWSAAFLRLGEIYSDKTRPIYHEQIGMNYFELYRLALCQHAEQGDPEAQYQWAMLLMNGRHVERDREKGLEWLRKAAEQEDPDALFTLAGLYLDGRGVPRDPARAMDFLQQAAEQGHEKAQARLEALRPQGE